MAEISRMVLDRQKSAQSVLAAARTHSSSVNQTVSSMLGAQAGSAAATLLGALADELDAKTRAMVAAEDAHARELADDPAHRAARDDAAGSLRAKMIEMKETLNAVVGAEYLVAINAGGQTPEDPAALLRAGSQMLQGLLSQPSPASRLRGFVVNREEFAAPLRAPLEALKSALESVQREAREADATLAARNTAVAAYDQAFVRTANTVSELLMLGGQTELSRKVRPSRRRAGVTTEAAGDPVADTLSI